MKKRLTMLLLVGFVVSGSEPAPAIVINEILADPAGDANGDGVTDAAQDEFIEFVNETASPLDVSGWTLSDGVAVRHIFPTGTTVPADCCLVLFGGGIPTGPFGQAVVQTASTGMLTLNNSGDTVTIALDGTPMATVTYGTDGGRDEALVRWPEVTGAFRLSSLIPGAIGPWSPGTLVTGASFSGCSATGVEAPNLRLVLHPATPNPFNPRTTIKYDLPNGGPVRLSVFDVAGRLVRTLVDDTMPQGSNEAVWDGRDSSGREVGSGSYLARLEFGGKVETVRVGLIR